MKLLVLELGLLAIAAVIFAFAFRPAQLGPMPAFGRLRARAATAWDGASTLERVLWIGVLLSAFALRLYHAGQTMRNDEAYTYLAYALSPLSNALSDYEYPNNHLFHTLLVWVSTRLFGGSPEAIRLPAFIAGMMVVVAVYAVARRFSDRATSLLAMALAAVWPALILYSTNARGYSIIVLAFLALLVLADRVADHEEGWPWLASAVIVAIGMYTAPVMLYPAGVAVLWALAERARRQGIASVWRLLPRVVAAGALAGVLALMGNLPVLLRGGLAPLISNQYVVALSFSEFVEAFRMFLVSLVASCAEGVPRSLLVVFAITGIVGVVAPGAGRAPRVTLATVALLWSTAIIVLMRRPPPGRVMLFLVPLAFVYIAIGTAFVLARFVRRWDYRLALHAATCGLALALGAYTVVARTVFLSRETGTLVDAPQIAEYLLASMRPGDNLAVASPSGPSLDYYMVRGGGPDILRIEREAARARVFVVVNRHEGQTLATVQARRSDFPWDELVPDGPPTTFAPGMVFVFRHTPEGS